MSFLTRTPGMTQREAREVCDLHELVTRSFRDGPVSLEIYQLVRGVKVANAENAERNARRLVKRLKECGYVVATEGDADKLTLDFSDRRLARHTRILLGEASRKADPTSVYDSGQNGEDDDDPHLAPLEQLAADHRLGVTIRGIMRRYGIRQERARVLLAAKGCRPHRVGRLRIEEERSSEVTRRALEARGEGAGLRRVAEILGCSPETARAFLRRVKHANTPREGRGPLEAS